jgi:hypothetical protein
VRAVDAFRACPVIVAQAWFLAAAAIASQPDLASQRSVSAVRLEPDDSLTIDGPLAEAVWGRPAPAADFRQQDPVNGEPATEPTEVRIVYDSSRLVIGVQCRDAEPGRATAHKLQRGLAQLVERGSLEAGRPEGERGDRDDVPVLTSLRRSTMTQVESHQGQDASAAWSPHRSK